MREDPFHSAHSVYLQKTTQSVHQTTIMHMVHSFKITETCDHTDVC